MSRVVRSRRSSDSATSTAETDDATPLLGARYLLAKHFEEDFFRSQTDVPADASPIDHYLRHGRAQRLDACSWFSGHKYLQVYPDVDASGLDPLVHYLVWGRAEGRRIEASTFPDAGDSATQSDQPLIGLVTQELPVFGASGGLGAAFEELAIAAGKAGLNVVLVWAPRSLPSEEVLREAMGAWRKRGVSLRLVDWRKYAHQLTPSSHSFAVYRFLKNAPGEWLSLHFPDYGGLGFASLMAKRQGVAFETTKLVAHLHGATRWAREINGVPFLNQEQLLEDHLERTFVSGSDEAISTSRYLADWYHENLVAPEREIHVMRSLIDTTAAGRRTGGLQSGSDRAIVFLGRHEERKGLVVFCRALDRLNSRLSRSQTKVLFVGALGEVAGWNSAVFLGRRAREWRFPWEIIATLDKAGVRELLESLGDPVVVVASHRENCPNVVLEPAALGLQVVSSDHGGGPEIFTEASRNGLLFRERDPESLASAIEFALDNDDRRLEFAVSDESAESTWLDILTRPLPVASATPILDEAHPRVTVGITHFNRTHEITYAIKSILKQDYAGDIELIVCDDGSRDDHLEALRTSIGSHKVQLIQQENRYLGAARNRILAEATGDFIVFLDDDDMALPWMVSRLVDAAMRTGTDGVGAYPTFFHHEERALALKNPEQYADKVSHIHVGGPLSLIPWYNSLGGPVALFGTDRLRRLGGYSEDYGIGYEDFELLLRLLGDGGSYIVHPEPLYLYEAGRPSMVTTVNLPQSHQRVLRTLKPQIMATALADMASLVAGEVSSAEQIRLRDFSIQTSDHPWLLQQIHAAGGPTQDTLGLIAQYSEMAGLAGLRGAILGGLTSAQAISDLNRSRAATPAASQMLRDLVLGSESVDLAAIAHEFLEAEWQASAADLENFLVIDWSRLLHEAHFGSLLVKLLRNRESLSPEEAPVLYAATCWLASTMGQWEEFALALTDLVLVEDANYLSTHEDVARGIPEFFSHGAEHYRLHGFWEGRPGFRFSRGMMDFQRQCGNGSVGDVDPRLSALAEIFTLDQR